MQDALLCHILAIPEYNKQTLQDVANKAYAIICNATVHHTSIFEVDTFSVLIPARQYVEFGLVWIGVVAENEPNWDMAKKYHNPRGDASVIQV